MIHRTSKRFVAFMVVSTLVVVACTNDDGREGGPFDLELRQPNSCAVAGCVGASVDTATGALVVEDEDLLFPQGVFGIELARSYRSDRERAGWFGRGWATVYETTLTLDGDDGAVIDAATGIGPLWAPEAPEDWSVAGSPEISAGEDGGALLEWPTGESWSFDDDGRFLAAISPYGSELTVDRSAPGVVSIRSSQGLSLDLTLVDDRVTSVASSDGREVTYLYEDDRLTGATAATGDIEYAYNADGRMVGRTAPEGEVSSTYSERRVVEQVLPGGDRVDLTYADGTTTVTVDGRTSELSHDGDGRLIRRSEGTLVVLERTYDSEGRLTEESVFGGEEEVASHLERSYQDGRLIRESLDGIARGFVYDERGRVTRVTVGDEVVEFDYDGSAPLPVIVSTPESGMQQFDYDDRGFVVRSVDATGVQTVMVRDALGNPVGLAQGERASWRFDFDQEGNQLEMTSPGGRTWTNTWLPGRLLAEQRDPLGRATTRRFDTAGREVATTSAGGATIRTAYDSSGRITRREEPDGLVTSYRYATDGGLGEVVHPGDRSWTYRRAVADGVEVETARSPDGAAIVTTRDGAGRVIRLDYRDADGELVRSTEHGYEFGRLVETVTDEGRSRHVTAIDYDDGGRMTAVAESLDGSELRRRSFGYDAGRLTRVVDADGSEVAYSYDEAGRLTQVSSQDEVRRGIYEQGLLAQVESDVGLITVRYDEDARVVGIDQPDANSVSWVLDDAGRPLTRTMGTVSAHFTWSLDDELVGYLDAAANAWTWAFDPAGRLIEATESTGAVTTYEYVNGQVTRIRGDGGDTDDRDDRFEYHPATGQLLEARVRGETTKVTYDALNRVSTIDGPGDPETWRYDAAGRVVESWIDDDRYRLSYDNGDRLTSVAGPQERALSASYDGDALQAVVTSERTDPIQIERDDLGRLAAVDWNADHRVELSWAQDQSSLTVSQPGEERQATYRIVGNRIVAFADADREIDANVAPNGTFEALTLRDAKENITGRVTFDAAGRPDQLQYGERRAQLTFDDQGRVRTIDTSEGVETERTTISYEAGLWDIDGDDDLARALFSSTGHARAALPGFLNNPTRPADPYAEALAAAGLGELPGIEVPEPDPLGTVQDAIRDATPFVPSATGVGDLEALAEHTAATALHRDAPVFRLNGDQLVRLPILDPETGNLAAFNPFIDGSAAGLALGALDLLVDHGRNLLDRAVDAVTAAVGGVVDVLSAVGRFLIEHPVGSIIPDIANVVGCLVATALCVPLTVAMQMVAVTAVVNAGIDFVAAGVGSCMRLEMATCGLAVATIGVSALVVYQAARLSMRLFAVARASRALATAPTTQARALASGRLGVRKSELAAMARGERIIARERPVCIESACARIDLVSKSLIGRPHFIEAKNGPLARLTSNQVAVYPQLRQTGQAYLPSGLFLGSPPESLQRVRFQLDHWGR